MKSLEETSSRHLLIHRNRRQMSGCQGQEQEKMGSDLLMSTRFPFGMMERFWNQIVVMVAQHS